MSKDANQGEQNSTWVDSTGKKKKPTMEEFKSEVLGALDQKAQELREAFLRDQVSLKFSEPDEEILKFAKGKAHRTGGEEFIKTFLPTGETDLMTLSADQYVPHYEYEREDNGHHYLEEWKKNCLKLAKIKILSSRLDTTSEETKLWENIDENLEFITRRIFNKRVEEHTKNYVEDYKKRDGEAGQWKRPQFPSPKDPPCRLDYAPATVLEEYINSHPSRKQTISRWKQEMMDGTREVIKRITSNYLSQEIAIE